MSFWLSADVFQYKILSEIPLESKQFRSRSGPMFCRPLSESKLFAKIINSLGYQVRVNSVIKGLPFHNLKYSILSQLLERKKKSSWSHCSYVGTIFFSV